MRAYAAAVRGIPEELLCAPFNEPLTTANLATLGHAVDRVISAASAASRNNLAAFAARAVNAGAQDSAL